MITAKPQTNPHGSGPPRRLAGWSSILSPNRSMFALAAAVAVYLLFALAWSAVGRRDADFAQSAAFAAACGAGAALIISIQAIFAERLTRSALRGWISIAIASAAAMSTAVAVFYAIWADGAVYWNPTALRILDVVGSLALVAGAVLLLYPKLIGRALIRDLTALALVVLAVVTLVALVLLYPIVDSPGRWTILAPVLSAALASTGLVVALWTLRFAEHREAGRAFGVAVAAAAWTASLFLENAGIWARSPGVVGLARWLFPIAALGVAAIALHYRQAAGNPPIHNGDVPERTGILPVSPVQYLGTTVLIGSVLIALAAGSGVTADLAVIGACAVLLQVATLVLDLRLERDRVKSLLDSTEQLERLANVDLLTQLPNRAALELRLAEEMERAIRYEQPLSLCFVDIDHFKSVNDRFGHGAGDAVLREVARSLEQTSRSIDFVGRLGGEEFLVIAPGTWSEDARVLGERLRAQVERLPATPGEDGSLRLTISVGIAGFPEHAETLPLLMERADQALYRSKASGRNRVTIWTPGVNG